MTLRTLLALAVSVVFLGGGVPPSCSSLEHTTSVGSPGMAESLGPSRPVQSSLRFDLNPSLGSAIANLPSTWAFNGTAVALSVDCRGSGASGTDLVCATGGTWPEAGTGTSPTADRRTFLTSSDDEAVRYNAGKHHLAPSTSTGEIGTDDYAIRVIVRFPLAGATAGTYVAGDRASADNQGWSLEHNSATVLRFNHKPASGSAAVAIDCPAGISGAWHVVTIFADRDRAEAGSGAICYLNAVAGTGTNVNARAETFANDGKIAIGANPNDANKGSDEIALFQLAHQASWFTGATNLADWQAFATDELAKLLGLYPAAGGVARPSTMTRASGATCDVNNGTAKQLFLLSSGLPCVSRRTERTGGEFSTGYLPTFQRTNIALQSDTLDNASWTKTNVAITANAVAGPLGDSTLDALEGDDDVAGALEKGVRQAITLTAARYTITTVARAGTAGFLVVRDNTVANARAWFNLSTCAVGTSGAGVEQVIDVASDPGVWGSSLCRVGITVTGTAASHDIDILCATADNDLDYVEAAANTDVDCYAGAVQVEQVNRLATNPFATTTASVTILGDALAFTSAESVGAGGGTMEVNFLAPNVNFTINNAFLAAAVESTTDSTDSYRFALDSSAFTYQGNTGGVAQWAIQPTSPDFTNAERRVARGTYTTNSVRFYVDGTETTGSPDTSATPTTTLGNITVGFFSSGNQPGVQIERVRFYSAVIPP